MSDRLNPIFVRDMRFWWKYAGPHLLITLPLMVLAYWYFFSARLLEYIEKSQEFQAETLFDFLIVFFLAAMIPVFVEGAALVYATITEDLSHFTLLKPPQVLHGYLQSSMFLGGIATLFFLVFFLINFPYGSDAALHYLLWFALFYAMLLWGSMYLFANLCMVRTLTELLVVTIFLLVQGGVTLVTAFVFYRIYSFEMHAKVYEHFFFALEWPQIFTHYGLSVLFSLTVAAIAYGLARMNFSRKGSFKLKMARTAVFDLLVFFALIVWVRHLMSVNL